MFQRKKKKASAKPRLIHDYILGETLGMGGYAKVKIGIHQTTGERVALKIMFANEQGEMTTSQNKQLSREINIMQQIQHENVIRLLHFWDKASYPQAGGLPPLQCTVTVLELCPGGELFDFLSFSGRFDALLTRTYFHQLIAGIDAIHSKGFVHRDIKPENLLLDAQFNLKIVDFGFATRYLDDQGKPRQMSTACGTRGYLAPEIYAGKYGKQVDIFACGIMLFTMYAGFPPFQEARTPDWWWTRILEGKYHRFWQAHERPDTGVPFDDDLKEMVEKVLHPKPHKRYDVQRIRAHKWFNKPVIHTKELRKEMNDRYRRIKSERAKKIAEQAKNNTTFNHSVIDESGGWRTVDGAADHPSTKVLQDIARMTNTIDAEQHFNRYTPDVSEAHGFDQTCFKFESRLQPTEIAGRVYWYWMNKFGTDIKADIHPLNNLLQIRVNAQYDTVTFRQDVLIGMKMYKCPDDTTLVCFKRLTGSYMVYGDVMRTFFLNPHPVIACIMGTDPAAAA